MMTILITQRLRLEPFDDAHLEGLYQMNSDPEVMRYITGKPETRLETQASITQCKARWAEGGLSCWSFFERDSNQIIGAGCIQYLGKDPVSLLEIAEIGWRLRQDKWRQGFASEAAHEMARFAFENIGTDFLCAVCDQDNLGSAKVMVRLGMKFRGIEPWYGKERAFYAMTRADWDALNPPLP